MSDPSSQPAPALGPIECFDRIDSTNEAAFRALEAGTAGHGAVFVALAQDAGRGRRGARWISPAGEGLYLSAIWRPRSWVAAPLLTMATGWAALEALRGLGVQGLRLKWPNDVVHASGKLAGMLVESRGLDPANPTFVVGMGINVAQTEFPSELLAQQAVTSLQLLGYPRPREVVQAAVIEVLPRAWAMAESDPEALCKLFLDATGLDGQRVRIEAGDQTLVGTIQGLDPELGLALLPDLGPLQTLRLEQIRSLKPFAG
ncbi:MAG: biotin--[acetyl-CoA-carboxylase] ligase [Planctomycetes bacterium]|nr:biotin--[acetyl-CoA-carboxylase] ligase [Planctomycetota bacterium]MCB9909129.1 biotin--[acetyl-CoA-carboxylase] ligase [Planctomycetota bacterium]MCB9911621.1 biotin--[acetyl-CoA-carboxylase] ligase [Planctomycetota bacterium]